MSGDGEHPLAAVKLDEERGNAQESDIDVEESGIMSSPLEETSPITPSLDTSVTFPWTRWVESLRLRKRGGVQPTNYVDGWVDGPSMTSDDLVTSLWDKRPWDQISGGSSSILGTVKTTSMSVPASSTPRSRTNTTTSSSIVVSRRSVESTRSSIYDAITQAGSMIAVRRRHVLREIYTSEVHYVEGLQTIVQILSAYLTMRPAILRDLQQLYDMHEAFKTQLECISPQSAENQSDAVFRRKSTIIQRFQHPPLLKRNFRRQVNVQLGKESADPIEALLVAREIDRLTSHFNIYEAFIRSFDVLSEDITILRQDHPGEGFWTEGIEALQKSVHSTQRRKENHKNSMTLDDLIAKPIQRVCKYRLLLSELLRTVPEDTYPSTHSEIKNILDRNVQAVERINIVVGEPELRIRIRKTISLHERLVYHDHSVLENVYQELGPLILCGVLHVAYHSSNGIAGQYLVCVLFSSYMVLSKSRSDGRKLDLIASIYLSDMTVDSSINGQGLACLDTPFSWKAIFQHHQKLYELIFSASSATEERVWKTEILKASVVPPDEVPTISLEPRRFSFVCIPLKPLEADYWSLLLKRRGSLRTQTSHSGLRQQQNIVMIKKTHHPLHENEVRLLQEAELTRSRSVAKQTMCTPTVLMPARAHRVKLEHSIVDVFSQDMLPYPGMTLGRSDYLQSQTMIRKSVIRGLSLRGVFHNRRSVSFSKIDLASRDDGLKTDGADDPSEEATELEAVKAARIGTNTAFNTNDIGGGDTELARSRTTRATFSSIRQRMAGTVSDNITHEASCTISKDKPRVSWRRWLSSLSVLSLFNTTEGTCKS